MKNLALFLVGLLIGAGICYLIMNSKSDQSEKGFFGLLPPTQKQIDLVDSLETLLKKDRRVSRGLGTRIPERRARRHINDFKSTKMALDPALKSLNVSLSSSYSFGLDEITSLCRDIDSLNRYRTSLDSLTGIRIHLGKSQKTIGGEEVFYIDAFITPVDKEGKHIFESTRIAYTDIKDKNLKKQLKVQGGGSTSLNNSNPCPDVCE